MSMLLHKEKFGSTSFSPHTSKPQKYFFSAKNLMALKEWLPQQQNWDHNDIQSTEWVSQ